MIAFNDEPDTKGNKFPLRTSIKYWLLIVLGCVLLYGNHERVKSKEQSDKSLAYMQGTMNSIYYFRHRHREPNLSWIMVSMEHGQIEDTEKEVSNLEIKALAWEVDHFRDTSK